MAIKTITWSQSVILVLMLFSLVFLGVCQPQAWREGVGGQVASVGGVSINHNAFLRSYEYLNASKDADQQGQDISVAEVMEHLIHRLVLAQEAENLGIVIGEEEVAEFLRENDFFLDKGSFSEVAFKKFLKEKRYTERSLVDEVSRDLSVDFLRKLVSQTAFVGKSFLEMDRILMETQLEVEYLKMDENDLPINWAEKEKDFWAQEKALEQAERYYETHKDSFKKFAEVSFSYVPLSSEEKSRILAKDLYEKLKNGQMLEELTGELSLDGSAVSAKWFPVREEASLEGKVYDLAKNGEKFSVLNWKDKIYVLQIEGFHPMEWLSFEEVKSQVAQSLLKAALGSQEAKKVGDSLREKLLSGGDISEDLESWKLRWQKTGLFFAGSRHMGALGNKLDLLRSALSLEEGQISPLLRSQGGWFLLRVLKKTKVPQDSDREKMLRMTQSLTARYEIVEMFESQVKDQYEASGKIHRNSEYLSMSSS